MRQLVYALMVLLAVLHQDFWWWDSEALVGDFLPVGLAYHAGISLAAGALWALAGRFCWPVGIDDHDEAASTTAADAGSERP